MYSACQKNGDCMRHMDVMHDKVTILRHQVHILHATECFSWKGFLNINIKLSLQYEEFYLVNFKVSMFSFAFLHQSKNIEAFKSLFLCKKDTPVSTLIIGKFIIYVHQLVC